MAVAQRLWRCPVERCRYVLQSEAYEQSGVPDMLREHVRRIEAHTAAHRLITQGSQAIGEAFKQIGQAVTAFTTAIKELLPPKKDDE